MSGTLSRGTTFSSNEQITNTKLHNLVDGGTVSDIDRTDMDTSTSSLIHLAGVAPGSPSANELWYDTANDQLKRYNSGTAAFEEIVSSTTVLTNQSGGALTAGDVVVVDTGNDLSFTTTTTASSDKILGILVADTANGATGVIASTGIFEVNCEAVTVGEFLETGTTAGRGKGVSVKSLSSAGIILETQAGPGLVKVALFL